VLERRVVGDASFQRHCLVRRLSGQLAARNIYTSLAEFHHLGCALECSHFRQPRHVLTVQLHLETEVAVRIKAVGAGIHSCHNAISPCPYNAGWLTFWLSFSTTNSAGLSGAKPTRMLTTPLSISCCVVVVLSHLTKKASSGLLPWKAPARNCVNIKERIFSRKLAQSGSSLGSKTAHWM